MYIQSEETRKKRSESLKRAYAEGRHKRGHSEETKVKISQNRIGKALGNTNANGNIPWNKGKPHNVHTKQWRQKVSEANSGSNHWNWKGGHSKYDRLERSSAKHKNWMHDVFQRDGWTCQLCGKHGQKGEIVAHHIFSFAKYKNIRYEISNGLTLCRSCHCEIHKPRVGTGKTSKKNGVNSGKLSIETILSRAVGEIQQKVQRLTAEAKSIIRYAGNADTSALAERYDIV